MEQKKLSRRDFLLLSGTATAGTLLAACQQQVIQEETPVGVEEAVEAPTAEPVTLDITGWGEPTTKDALEGMAQAFQDTTPDIEINWMYQESGSWGREKVLTMIAGGDAPDCLMMNTGMFEGFAARGALRALDDLVAADTIDMDAYWPQALKGCTYADKLFAMPRDLSNHPLYYNKDMFDEVGMPYPEADWDWNEFLEIAKQLTMDTSGDGNTDQWGYGIFNATRELCNFIWSNGGAFIDLENGTCLFEMPETIEAIDFYFDLELEHGVSPPPGSLPEMANSKDYFKGKRIAMGSFGPWFRPQLMSMSEEDRPSWGVAMMPKSPNTGQIASALYTDMFGVFSGCPHVDEAWQWIKFLSSKEGRLIERDVRGPRSISPIKELALTEEWLTYGGVEAAHNGQVFLDLLEYSETPPVNFAHGNAVENVWRAETGLILAGEKTAEEAAADICEQITPILALD
jgi:multiple sugar transport system substrate-binding protein